MPNLREIKKRINSVQSTKQITRTMEMVASAKIRHSFERIQAAAPAAKEKREKKVKPAAPDKSLEKQLRAIEREIEKQEALLHEYDGKIDAAASDYQELSRLMAERETAENAYAEMMERWEALSLRLEGAE
mgnify:CR=1 FL=1